MKPPKEYARDLSTADLIAQFKELDSLIFVENCFGVNDMILYTALEIELAERQGIAEEESILV